VDTKLTPIDGFRRAVDGVRRAFPSLRIHVQVDEGNPFVEASASLPPQPGLEFGVGFSLQSRDELHLNVGTTNLRVEWFPCTEPAVVDTFVDAVSGILSGRYRIVERSIGDHVVSVQLQRPLAPDRWARVATWSTLGSLIPWPRNQTIVRNSAGDGDVVKI